MAIVGVNIQAHRFPSALARVAPYYGTADVGSTIDEALVKSLQFRGERGTFECDFAIDAIGATVSCFFAYPKKFGMCEFLDVNSSFVGGWDGADPPNFGPIEVIVDEDGEKVPFYVFKSDHPNWGAAAINSWIARPVSPD